MNIFKKLIVLENEATDFGFKWERPHQIKQQIISELDEIEVHLHDHDRQKLQEEIGDLLHAAFSLTIFCGFDAEETLQMSLNKFERRLTAVKAIAAEREFATLEGKSFNELMQIWEQAKTKT